MRDIQEPTVTTGAGVSGDEIKEVHPAYAQVSFSHVSGSGSLYGSDFEHQHYVTLKICRSELHRSLNRDWHFEREQYIEIALSEAQFATLVANPNRQGVPCTLLYKDHEAIPGLPRRDSSKMFGEEHKQKIQKTVDALKRQRDEIATATSKLPKKTQAEILGPINKAIMEMESNLPFLVNSFSEHIEKNVEKAKIEVNAYVTQAINRAGLEALQGCVPVLTYEPSSSNTGGDNA